MVTEEAGTAGAVLFRDVEPLAGVERMRAHRPRARRAEELGNGPGKLARALAIGPEFNGRPRRWRMRRSLCRAAPAAYEQQLEALRGRFRRPAPPVTAREQSEAIDWMLAANPAIRHTLVGHRVIVMATRASRCARGRTSSSCTSISPTRSSSTPGPDPAP